MTGPVFVRAVYIGSFARDYLRSPLVACDEWEARRIAVEDWERIHG